MKLASLTHREKFLILEILPSGAHGLFLSIDDDRNLIFEKFLENIDLQKFLKSPRQSISQKYWEGQHLFKSHRKIIAIADSRVATTIPIPLDLHREPTSFKEKVTLGELENAIAQGMAKIFNQCRGEAAKRLAIDDLDAVLVGAKTSRLRIDGRAVENPVGRTGKKISLLLELIFARRDCFENLKQFFNAPDEFFFAESPQAHLTALARTRSLPLSIIVARNQEPTSLFILAKTPGGDPVLYRETLAWDQASLIDDIAKDLAITHSVAEELYQKYLAGNTSPSATRHLEKIVKPAAEKLLAEISRAKIKGTIYLDIARSLPFELPYRHGGATITSLPSMELVEPLGFTLGNQSIDLAPSIAARYLAVFLEAYFDKSSSEINQKLKRRLHWLAE